MCQALFWALDISSEQTRQRPYSHGAYILVWEVVVDRKYIQLPDLLSPVMKLKKLRRSSTLVPKQYSFYKEIFVWIYLKVNHFLRSPSFLFFFFNLILFIFLYSRFLLVIHFIHISEYMSIPISQFITPPPRRGFPPLATIRLSSTSVSLFLPCKPVHLYSFLDSIYMR